MAWRAQLMALASRPCGTAEQPRNRRPAGLRPDGVGCGSAGRSAGHPAWRPQGRPGKHSGEPRPGWRRSQLARWLVRTRRWGQARPAGGWLGWIPGRTPAARRPQGSAPGPTAARPTAPAVAAGPVRSAAVDQPLPVPRVTVDRAGGARTARRAEIGRMKWPQPVPGRAVPLSEYPAGGELASTTSAASAAGVRDLAEPYPWSCDPPTRSDHSRAR